MTFKFKRSYFSLVELRFRLKGRKAPRTIYAGGRLSRPFYVIGFISCLTYRHTGKETTHLWTQCLTSKSNWNKLTFLATKRLFPCIWSPHETSFATHFASKIWRVWWKIEHLSGEMLGRTWLDCKMWALRTRNEPVGSGVMLTIKGPDYVSRNGKYFFCLYQKHVFQCWL